MPYYTYVLQSYEGYHYTGHTSDLTLRLTRHELHTTHYTKKGTNWKIIYVKEFLTRADAMKYEKWLKVVLVDNGLKSISQGGVRRRRSSSLGS